MTEDFAGFLWFIVKVLAHIVGFIAGLIGVALFLPTLGWSLKPFHLWGEIGIKLGLFEKNNTRTIW